MDNKLEVKFELTHPDAVMPTKAHPTDAGADITAVSVERDTHGCIVYGTGLKVAIPLGYMGLLFPRSSIYKKGLILSNCVGVIDNTFLGELTFKFKPSTTGVGGYAPGDRVGQLVIMPYPEVEYVQVKDLGESSRGGFGSSGD